MLRSDWLRIYPFDVTIFVLRMHESNSNDSFPRVML